MQEKESNITLNMVQLIFMQIIALGSTLGEKIRINPYVADTRGLGEKNGGGGGVGHEPRNTQTFFNITMLLVSYFAAIYTRSETSINAVSPGIC